MSHELDNGEETGNKFTFVMSFAGRVEGLKDARVDQHVMAQVRHLPSDKVCGRCSAHSHHHVHHNVGPVRESRLVKFPVRN